MRTPPAFDGTYEAHTLYVPSGPRWKGLILGALLALTERWRWELDPSGISIDAALLAIDYTIFRYQEAHTMIGAIFAAVGPVPSNALQLNGQTVSAADYPLLASVVPSSWLGMGGSIVLPDLSGRVLLGAQNSGTVGDLRGNASHTLSVDNLPAHSHGYLMPGPDIDVEQPVGVPIPSAGLGVPSVTDSAGLGTSFDNTPAGMDVRWCIWAG